MALALSSVQGRPLAMLANKKASLGQVGKAAPVRRVAMPVRASAQDIGMLIAAAAEEAVKPGSVDAPIGAIIGGALLVTVVLTAGVPALLNPGSKAAEKIFERDARTGRKR